MEADSTAPAWPAEVGWWDRCAFQTVRTAIWILAKVLTLDGLYRFGRCFGTLEWCVNYKRRGAFGKRLREVYGPELTPALRRRETRAHFQTFRCDKIFYLILDMLSREEVLERFHLEGREALDAAIARGRGVYFLTSHLGSFHLAGLCLSLLGYRVSGIRAPNEGALRRFMQQKYLQRHPEFRTLRVLFSDTYPREIYRCFQENYILGSSLDVRKPREAHQKTVGVTMFGQERNFLTGTLQIALRCGSTVLQTFIISEPGFHYRFHVLGPLTDPEGSQESPELLARVMQTYASNIETFARRYPSHITQP